MEVEEQPEERDRVVREADSVGTWVPIHTRDEDVDKLSGKPVRELFSRGESGQRERVLGIEAPQGKDAKGGGFGDDPTPEKAGDVFRLQERVPIDYLSPCGQPFICRGISRVYELFVVGPYGGVQPAVQGNGGFLVIRLQNWEHLGYDVYHAVSVVAMKLPYELCSNKAGPSNGELTGCCSPKP